MSQPGNAERARRRQGVALALLLLIQTMAAVFYIGDVIEDARHYAASVHMVIEGVVTLALAVSVGLGAGQLRRTLERMREQEAALEVARGALSEVIEGQFARWGLTPAERDVGLMALKGLDVAEIAAIRGAAQGTVRAQLTRIYAKAGVSGRAQFAAWFVEDLMAEGLGARAAG